MEMSDSKKIEETFLVKVATGWRVTIYEPIRSRLNLKIGELVRVTVRKDET